MPKKVENKKELSQYDPRVLYKSRLNKEVCIVGKDYTYDGILRHISQFEIVIEYEEKFIILFKHSITMIRKIGK